MGWGVKPPGAAAERLALRAGRGRGPLAAGRAGGGEPLLARGASPAAERPGVRESSARPSASPPALGERSGAGRATLCLAGARCGSGAPRPVCGLGAGARGGGAGVMLPVGRRWGSGASAFPLPRRPPPAPSGTPRAGPRRCGDTPAPTERPAAQLSSVLAVSSEGVLALLAFLKR